MRSPCSYRLTRCPEPLFEARVASERSAGHSKVEAGGARIIYYNRLANGEIWLLTIYAKGDRSTIPAHELKLIKETIDDD